MWRQVLIARDWIKLQGHRNINVFFSFVMLMLVLVAGNVLGYSSVTPSVSVKYTADETHPILRFFLTAIAWLCIDLAQVSCLADLYCF